jgi:hypothetical protein
VAAEDLLGSARFYAGNPSFSSTSAFGECLRL